MSQFKIISKYSFYTAKHTIIGVFGYLVYGVCDGSYH